MNKNLKTIVIALLGVAIYTLSPMASATANSAAKKGYIDPKTGVKHPRTEKYIGIRFGRSWANTSYTNPLLTKKVGGKKINDKASFYAENQGFDLGIVAGFSKELNDVEITLEVGLDYNFDGEVNAERFKTSKDRAHPEAGYFVETQLLNKRSLTFDADLKIGTTFENDHIRPRLILGFTVARMQAYDHAEPEKVPYQTPYGANMGAEFEGKLSDKFGLVASYRYKNFFQGGIKGHSIHFGINRKF